MTQLYSTNALLKNRLNSIDIPVMHINNSTELDAREIIITDTAAVETLLSYNPHFNLFALTPSPSFSEGTALLAQGIKGYGNSFMHAKHLRRAIVTIKEGNIWLPPSFMQELISHVVPATTSESTSALETLTKRQRETALLLKEGLSNKEIAQQLHITERTVKAHISAIFERTGITDRLSLAMYLNNH